MKAMGKIKSLWKLIREHGYIFVGLVVSAFLLLFRLGSVPLRDSLSGPEAALLPINANAHQVLNYGFYLPITTLQYLFNRFLPLHSVSSLRVASVVFAGLAVASMLYVVKRWYGTRVLFFALPIVITSAAILHIGRLATTDVLYLVAMPLLIASHVALNNKPERKLIFLGWIATLVLLMYIPGLVWLVVLQLIWQRDAIKDAFVSFGTWFWQVLLLALTALSLAPLIYAFVRNLNSGYLLTWLGFPTEVPSYMIVAKNAAASVLFIFAKTPNDPARWLGHLPLLGAFMLVCFVAGILFYISHIKAERTQLLLSLAAIGFVLTAIGGVVPRSLLIPLVYLVAFGGLAYIMHYWLKIFPFNPVARRTGILLITIAVSLACVYNLRHYYIAWPHNAATREAFDFHIGAR